MSTQKKIIIAVIVILLLIGSFMLYKRFTKPASALDEAKAALETAKPVDIAALTKEKEALMAKIAAEKYKLFNMERYMKTMTDQVAWEIYKAKNYDPLKSTIDVLTRKLDEMNVIIAANA